MVLFFAIVCVCGIMIWVKHTQSVSPFLISINQNGERWTMVHHKNHQTEIPAYYVLQESLLNKFTRDWFTIYNDNELNSANWEKCDRSGTECRETSGQSVSKCSIYCTTNDAVFDGFEKVVLPVYSNLVSDGGDVWTVKTINIAPVDSVESITTYGGFWRINVGIHTKTGMIYFTCFAKIGYNADLYPKTMGYYVSEFYTYRMDS